MLQVNNVNLEVGNAVLLHNINITLELGKIYGVLGSNGAGKTTMFKSMLGLTDFTGEILSDNQPVSSRLFGSLIEYPAFYPKLTAEENLRLHAKYLQINNPDIRTALEQVNLWEARNKLFSQLSLGMRQRLGIARAFLGNVTYLFLPRLSFTVTFFPLSDFTASLIEFMDKFTLIILLFLPILP